MVLAGLVAAEDQFLLWQQGGFGAPLRFAALWTALFGPSSDPMWLSNIPGIAAWLLDQPVSKVLPAIGGCLAWIGMDGVGGIWPRL